MANLPTSSDSRSASREDIEQWHHTATRALDASDRLINTYFRKSLTIHNKLDDADTSSDLTAASFDPVTAADRGAEQVIRDTISTDFPDHGIIGEEFAEKAANGSTSWIIDPIDGTRAFVAGLPTFGTLLGVLRHGMPVFGAMSQPFTRERYWGSVGGSQYQGPDGTRTLTTSAVAALNNATLATTDPTLFSSANGERERFESCRDAARIVRYGGDCYAYCQLAAGHIDIVIESGLQSYDIAALIPIIEGAGGTVTNWTGGPAHDGGQVVAASTLALHHEALRILGR